MSLVRFQAGQKGFALGGRRLKANYPCDFVNEVIAVGRRRDEQPKQDGQGNEPGSYQK